MLRHIRVIAAQLSPNENALAKRRSTLDEAVIAPIDADQRSPTRRRREFRNRRQRPHYRARLQPLTRQESRR